MEIELNRKVKINILDLILYNLKLLENIQNRHNLNLIYLCST